MLFRKLSAPLEDTRFSDPQGRQCTAIRNENCWRSVVNVATLSSSVAASGARCRRISGPAEIPFPAGGYKGPDIRRRMRSFALGLRRVPKRRAWAACAPFRHGQLWVSRLLPPFSLGLRGNEITSFTPSHRCAPAIIAPCPTRALPWPACSHRWQGHCCYQTWHSRSVAASGGV
jgi:hypothetical protein